MPRTTALILLALAALQVLCASPMGAGVFLDSLSGERNEVLEDSHDEILLVHQRPLDETGHRVQLTLAIPPSGEFSADVVGWHLTSIVSPEETMLFESPGEAPVDLRTRNLTRLENVGFVRHTRLARLRISPHRITLSDYPGQWMITGVEVRIDLSGAGSHPAAPPDPLARPAIERLVINPEGVERWATGDPPHHGSVEPAAWWPEPDADRWVRMETDATGPMRLDLGRLESAGVDMGNVDLERIEMVHHGEPLPLWVAPTGEALFFVVPEGREPFSATTTLWLDLRGREGAARLDVVTTALPTPEEEHWDPLLETVIEENVDPASNPEALIEPSARMIPDTFTQGVRGVWTWCSLEPNTPIEVPVPPLRGEGGTRTRNAAVGFDLVSEDGLLGRVGAIRLSTPDGSSREMAFPGRLDFEATLEQPISAELVAAGALVVTPVAVRQSRQRTEPHLDRIRLMRPVTSLAADEANEPFHLSPPLEANGEACLVDTPPGTLSFRIGPDSAAVIAPLIVNGGRAGRIALRGEDWRCVVSRPQALPTPSRLEMWEPVDLRSSDQRADMLIVTSPMLIEAAERLSEHHRAMGLTARAVTTAQIYDCHGEGIASPTAIRRFLADAFRRAEGAPPAFVTLLGDCSRDHHGQWPTPVINHVPSFTIANANALETEWQASDLQHALISGDDPLADYFLGRLSVVDLETAEAVVDKVIRYATSAPTGTWRMSAGSIADNDRVGSETFDEMCETVRTDGMNAAVIADQVYLRDLPWVDNFYLPAELIQPDKNKVSVVATSQIRDMFDAGRVIVTYFGHGGPNIWADERIWFGCDSPRSDNLRLTETERLPLLINMTCSSGAIDYPGEVFNICISEDFLRVPGGAIACYVPTGEGVPSQHQRLTAHLMDTIFEQGVRGIGEAITAAGWRFIIEGRGSNLVEDFVLLGDPAMNLALPTRFEERVPRPAGLHTGQPHTLTMDATPSTVFSGEGVAWLTEPGGRIFEERPLTLDPEQSPDALQFEIAADAPAGRWTAAVLWWDEAAGIDEVVWSAWDVGAPEMTLLAWRSEGESDGLREGDALRVIAELAVESPVAPEPFTLGLFDEADAHPGNPIATVWVSPGVGMQRDVPVTWAAEVGLHRLRLDAVEDGVAWSSESIEALDERLDLAVVGAGAPASVVSSPAHVTPMPRRSNPSLLEAVRVTVGNTGSTDARRVRINLMSSDGLRAVAESDEIPALPGGAIRTVDLEPIESTPISAEARGTVRIDWLTAEDERVTSRVPVNLSRPRPDLTILSSDWSVVPESPSEGETVFVEAVVLNRGEAEVRSSSVRLENARGGSLPNRAEPAIVPLPRLLPGQEHRVRLRWDPARNAGDREILVVADPTREVVESDEENNTLAIPLHVRTGEDVRFTQAVRWENPQPDPPSITLTTQISNFGETDGHDLVITWYRDQEATSVIGETVIDVIPAGATQRIEFLWEMSPEDVARQRAGEAISPTCDLGIRVGTRRVVPPEGGTP